MFVVITIPGMGKTTFCKRENTDKKYSELGCVDFDYHCPWREMDVKIRSANSRTIEEWIRKGANVLVNAGWVNPQAWSKDIHLVFAFPKDADAIRKRIEERDGNDEISSLTTEFIEGLTKLSEEAKKRQHHVDIVTVDLIDEVFELIDTKGESEPTDDSESDTDGTSHTEGEGNNFEEGVDNKEEEQGQEGDEAGKPKKEPVTDEEVNPEDENQENDNPVTQ